jgi:hypothetical protein
MLDKGLLIFQGSMRYLFLCGLISHSLALASRFVSPEFLTTMFPKPHEQLKEYLLDRKSLEIFQQIPEPLRPYAFLRLNLVQLDKSASILSRQKVFQEFKQKKETFPSRKKLTTWIRLDPARLQLRFFIKYKGVKQTKDQRPHLLLNYLAREGEIAEGFEASENLQGTFHLSKNQKIVSYIGVFEKWVNHRLDYDSTYFLTMDHPDVVKDVKVTGTLKYALGWNFEKTLQNQQKFLVHVFMQHKANNHWKYKNSLFTSSSQAKAGFDHWVVTLGLGF